MNNATSIRSAHLPAMHQGRLWRWRRAGALAMLGPLALLGACASAPPHYPSATAQARIGKPLFNLEMRWSTPSGLREVHGGRLATWRFNQYNFSGCKVMVHTDRHDIIRKVTWTNGCGPKAAKATKTAKASAAKR